MVELKGVYPDGNSLPFYTLGSGVFPFQPVISSLQLRMHIPPNVSLKGEKVSSVNHRLYLTALSVAKQRSQTLGKKKFPSIEFLYFLWAVTHYGCLQRHASQLKLRY